jgi:hypothetical protein
MIGRLPRRMRDALCLTGRIDTFSRRGGSGIGPRSQPSFWDNRGVAETSAKSDLLALLRERRMLLFVGAGLSFDLGYPLWSKYLDALE